MNPVVLLVSQAVVLLPGWALGWAALRVFPPKDSLRGQLAAAYAVVLIAAFVFAVAGVGAVAWALFAGWTAWGLTALVMAVRRRLQLRRVNRSWARLEREANAGGADGPLSW